MVSLGRGGEVLRGLFARRAPTAEVAIFMPYAEDSSNRVANVLAAKLYHEIASVNLRLFLVGPKPNKKVDEIVQASEDLRRKNYLHSDILRDVVFPFQLEKGLNGLSPSTLLAPELLQEKYKGRVFIEHVIDVNDPKFIQERIRDNAALQMAFSVRNLQIFHDEIIEAFAQKGEARLMNTHPARLPAIRGLEGPFWTRYLGADRYTTTLHVVVRDIDAGDIVAYKTKAINGDSTKAVMQYTREIAPEVADMIYDQISYRLVMATSSPTLNPQGSDFEYFRPPTQEVINDAKRSGIILTDPDEQIEWLSHHYGNGHHAQLMRRLVKAHAEFEGSLLLSIPTTTSENAPRPEAA